MNIPLVTILIPTYNRAEFLRVAVQSAVTQTHRDLEILILDDASPDDTASVAAEFADDPRVIYIRHPNNLGIAGNWRAGIERARGEFFCLLHDDDTFEPTFVEKLVQPLQNDASLILAFCDHWVMDGTGIRRGGETAIATRRFHRDGLQEGPSQDWAELALIHSGIPVGATLFRTKSVPPRFIDDGAKGAIDSWLFYQCVKSGSGSFYRAERLMNYRLHGGGMSRNAALYMGEGHIFRYQAILLDQKMSALHTKIRQQLASTLASYGIELLVSGHQRDAQRSLRESLHLQSSKRAYFAYGLSHTGHFGVRVAGALRSK